MAAVNTGPCHWSVERDAEGHRDYKAVFKVRTDDADDGPAAVLACPTLPAVGSFWSFGNDLDLWAFCRPDFRVTQVGPEDERNVLWLVEVTFTTRPWRRCQDTTVEDPTLEPAKIGGSFVKYTVEATHDADGRPIVSSSLEQLRGPEVEFDNNRPTVRIEQNVATVTQAAGLPAQLMDTVNSVTLWGFPPGTVKLCGCTWERRYYGTCYAYYHRVLEFDINYDGFERYLLDEGTKVLHGRWSASGAWELLDINGVAPDPLNPAHFDRFQDRQGNYCRVVLDGQGQPAGALSTVTAEGGVAVTCAPGTTVPRLLAATVTLASDGSDYDLTLAYDEATGLWYGSVQIDVVPAYTLFFGCGDGGTDCTDFTLLGASTADILDVDFAAVTPSDPTGTGLDCAADPLEATFDAISSLFGTLRVKVEATFLGGETEAGRVRVRYYPYANHLLLGIPTSL